eukprot:TRINITY_DN8218_c0_g1_i2.p1 TRINITY_DN8218_c0_g1~~TRINITY_DN8218_c0_g1_i2.p1  ORF type:complete len:356 (-),score=57.37 TRINITY_DN8218_c0_g1_i2:131-1198(-)
MGGYLGSSGVLHGQIAQSVKPRQDFLYTDLTDLASPGNFPARNLFSVDDRQLYTICAELSSDIYGEAPGRSGLADQGSDDTQTKEFVDLQNAGPVLFYKAAGSKRLIVVFRGTSSAGEFWQHNHTTYCEALRPLDENFHYRGDVAAGWLQKYVDFVDAGWLTELEDFWRRHPGVVEEICFTGHSSGCPVACLAALDKRLDCWALAQNNAAGGSGIILRKRVIGFAGNTLGRAPDFTDAFLNHISEFKNFFREGDVAPMHMVTLDQPRWQVNPDGGNSGRNMTSGRYRISHATEADEFFVAENNPRKELDHVSAVGERLKWKGPLCKLATLGKSTADLTKYHSIEKHVEDMRRVMQ